MGSRKCAPPSLPTLARASLEVGLDIYGLCTHFLAEEDLMKLRGAGDLKSLAFCQRF